MNLIHIIVCGLVSFKLYLKLPSVLTTEVHYFYLNYRGFSMIELDLLRITENLNYRVSTVIINIEYRQCSNWKI